jgi:phage shock protein A
MTAPAFQPDAEQHARQLIEQAARYVRAALEVPEDVQTLRTLVANLLFEVAMLRAQVDELEKRVSR